MKKRIKNIIVTFLIIMVFIMESVIPKTHFVVNAQTIANSEQYTYDGYEVEFTVVSQWGNTCNVEVKITNTSSDTLDNWILGLDSTFEIDNIWNADILMKEDGFYVVENAEWNQDIKTGESITFGFLASHAEEQFDFPSNTYLLMSQAETGSSDYQVEYSIENMWDTAYIGAIAIQNNRDSAIKDWTLQFDSEDEITSIWNAVIISHVGNTYVVKNMDSNQNIAVNDQVTIGFQAEGMGNNNVITNVKLSEVGMYNLDHMGQVVNMVDSDSDGISD